VYFDAKTQKSIYVIGRERTPMHFRDDMYVNQSGCFGKKKMFPIWGISPPVLKPYPVGPKLGIKVLHKKSSSNHRVKWFIFT
jgi:hypothetical protein